MIVSIKEIKRHARTAAERRDPVPVYPHPAGPKADAVWVSTYLKRAAEVIREVSLRRAA
jgi:hypothetical protein